MSWLMNRTRIHISIFALHRLQQTGLSIAGRYATLNGNGNARFGPPGCGRNQNGVKTMAVKTIAIIEDDEHIGNILETCLRQEGYRTIRAYSGTEARYLLADKRPDLVLLDLMLPGLSGEELLAEITGVPVIVVSAKTSVDDKVGTLLSGAADYLTKPFEMRELLARIAVQLRRSGELHGTCNAAGAKETGTGQETITAGTLTLDFAMHEAKADGGAVRLTKTEFAILKLLMQNEGRVLSKASILEDISPDTPDCTDSSLKQHVSNLRKKLRDIGGKDYIEAVWGIGFRFIAE